MDSALVLFGASLPAGGNRVPTHDLFKQAGSKAGPPKELFAALRHQEFGKGVGRRGVRNSRVLATERYAKRFLLA